MRKAFLLLVAVCYLFASSGVAMQWHYCMGKLRSIEFGTLSHKKTCGKCGMVKGSSNCCKDEVSLDRISDSHHQAQMFFSFLSFIAVRQENTVLSIPVITGLGSANQYRLHPPPGNETGLHILFCSFRC